MRGIQRKAHGSFQENLERHAKAFKAGVKLRWGSECRFLPCLAAHARAGMVCESGNDARTGVRRTATTNAAELWGKKRSIVEGSWRLVFGRISRRRRAIHNDRQSVLRQREVGLMKPVRVAAKRKKKSRMAIRKRFCKSDPTMTMKRFHKLATRISESRRCRKWRWPERVAPAFAAKPT